MTECISNYFSSLFPKDFDPTSMISFLAFVVVVVFILAVLIRVIHQKASKYNHALASAMALLFAYIVLMWLHGGVFSSIVKEAFSCLPLIDYDGAKITLFKFTMDDPIKVCSEFLYVFILSFILIGLDDLIPDAKNGFAWILVQIFITFVSLILYWFVLKCINVFAPGILDTQAPVILVGILGFMVALGLLKVVIGLLLVAVNPLLSAVSAFFSTHRLGQAVGKAVLCAVFLCIVCVFLYGRELNTFVLSDMNFAVCVFPMAVLVGLWFLVGCIL